MENVISAKEFIKRDYFKSYSEFYLTLAIGKVLNERGYMLNMDNIQVDPDSIPSEILKYYKNLLNDGIISLSMYEKGNTIIESGMNLDISFFTKVKLYEEVGDRLDWSYEYAKENYGDGLKDFFVITKMGCSIIHLVANHLIDVYLGLSNKKLVLHFDEYKSKTTSLYVNIYSCLQTLEWIRDYIDLDVDLTGYNVDLDYSIFCNNGLVAGHCKSHTVSEKLALIDKFKMTKGSILSLWTRSGMCENNPFGYITEASIIRLDEIGDNFLGVTKISINKTKEEMKLDYYDIDESTRKVFSDMLYKKPYLAPMEIGITSIGIDNYIHGEDMFITLLDESGYTQKTVTFDGEVKTIKMKEIDAIYWLLCQYDLEFDRELYKNMYNKGQDLLWDKYGQEGLD